jgi:hypothetical protein
MTGNTHIEPNGALRFAGAGVQITGGGCGGDLSYPGDH